MGCFGMCEMRMMVLVKVFDGGRWRAKSNDGFRWFRNGKVSDVGYAKLSCRYMYCDINGLWMYFRLIFSFLHVVHRVHRSVDIRNVWYHMIPMNSDKNNFNLFNILH